MAKTKGHTGTTTAVGDKSNKKRSAAEEHEEDSKTLKRAKPSVCKAAEELVCPILQGLPIDPVTAEDGQIYEREEIAKYLEKEGTAAISPVTRKKFKNKALFPSIHVRNTIEHLVDSGIIEGELADTWKERMTEKRESELMVKEWKEEAKEGDVDAMYMLAIGHLNGLYDLKEDEEEGYKWCKKGADLRDVLNMALAGHCLADGVGTEQNLSDGLILTSLSAQQGCSVACMFLGQLYYEGRLGVVKNIENAKYWLNKALEGNVGDSASVNSAGMDQANQWLREIEALEAAGTTSGHGVGNSENGDDSSEGESEDEE